MTARQVWLITGAGRGLGVDIAKAALAAGHAVVATGRDPDKVAAAIGDNANFLALKLDAWVGRPRISWVSEIVMPYWKGVTQRSE